MYIVTLNDEIISKAETIEDVVDATLEEEVPCLVYLYPNLIDEWIEDNPSDKSLLKRIKTELHKRNASLAIYGCENWYHIVPKVWSMQEARKCFRKVNSDLRIKEIVGDNNND